MVGEGEEPRQRVGIELGKLGGGQPLQEGHGGLLVLAGRVHPHADVGVIGKEATITLFGHRGAHDTEVHLAGEGGYLPGAGRIEGGLAGGEQLVGGGIVTTLAPLAEIGAPAGQFLEHLDVLRVVEPLLARDQRQPTILPFPVVGAYVLEAQLGGDPALRATHGQRHIAAIRLHLVEHGEELVPGLRHRQPQLAEDLLVVKEAVNDGGHGHAEGLGAAIGLPGGLGEAREVLHPGHLAQLRQVARLEQGQGVVERTAGDEIPGLARFQAGPEGRHVFDVLHPVEAHLDARVSGLEGGNDLLLPQGLVIYPPAFDHQLAGHQLATQQETQGPDPLVSHKSSYTLK